MPLDFDALVNAPVIATFGEGNTSTGLVTYQSLSGQSFTIDGIFDAAWQDVKPASGRHGVPVSTTKPCFGTRLANFPPGAAPVQNDTLTRANGELYTVADIQPDGFGYVYLILN